MAILGGDWGAGRDGGKPERGLDRGPSDSRAWGGVPGPRAAATRARLWPSPLSQITPKVFLEVEKAWGQEQHGEGRNFKARRGRGQDLGAGPTPQMEDEPRTGDRGQSQGQEWGDTNQGP